jgi:ferredoxin
MPTELELRAALGVYGLCLRGGFAPVAADGLAALPDGRAVAGVWMVGVIGSAFWPHFKTSTFFGDGLPDPLDRWSRAIGEDLATRWGGRALFPFEGPPYHPFQRWADRAEATQASRMMLRIHPQHGLWHAYRFALALPEATATATPDSIPAPVRAPDLCISCDGQPCLRACPVGAYTGEAFLVQACADHLHSNAGTECMQSGCLARRACPVAPERRYAQEHAAFHMQAFVQNH